MPTRYWLVGSTENAAVSRIEAAGGVRAAEVAVDAGALAAAHERYAAERDGAIPPGWTGPRPGGGVGGTRAGVKCLHAHYAYHLAGGDDPVGRWVAARLAAAGRAGEATGSKPGAAGQPAVAGAAPGGRLDPDRRIDRRADEAGDAAGDAE